MGDRLQEDEWWEEKDPGADVCLRCGHPLIGPKHTMVELQRVVSTEYGGLALQGVAVHRLCWELQLNQERYEAMRSAPVALASWEEMMASMRAQIAKRKAMDRRGEEWKGESDEGGPGEALAW